VTPSRSLAVRRAAGAAWARLRGGELTPWRAAMSVAVGLAIGVTPLYGLHLWIVLAICLPLKLDAPVAYLAANISLPFISPFLLFAEVEIGAWVRTGHGAALSLEALKSADRGAVLAQLAVEAVVGTAIFAPMMAALGFALTYALVSRARRTRSPMAEAIDRVATRFASGRRSTFYYVRSKLASDPVATSIAALPDLGEVVDAGCGRGQLALLLLEAKRATAVRGFDWDAQKIDDARAAASRDLAATFEQGDLRTRPIDPCDTVLLVDVLHYIDDAAQDALLARAATAARRRVIVRELDPDRGWRSTVTRWQERITTSARYNRGERVRPRSIDAIRAVLEPRGFRVSVTPCWGKTPFSNVLVVAERVDQATA
jgi:uncharacterized protein (DUF2062 family)